MTCDVARELLFDEQEGLLTAEERAALREHLGECAACRAEQAALQETYRALSVGVHELTTHVTPSPAFWQSLSAGLDEVDAERQAAQEHHRRPLPFAGKMRRRWSITLALLAALLAGLIGSGEARYAVAALRQWLSCVPIVGVCQVQPNALVAATPQSETSSGITLTVQGLVSGRRTTLLAYRLSGRGLAARSAAPLVADAVDATLIDGQGRRYAPTAWLPVRTGLANGALYVQGALAFPALAHNVTTLRLVAARLPLATPARPWALTLHLHAAASGAAVTSLPLQASDTHHGIRLAATDVTFGRDATVVDMTATVMGDPYSGGTIISLTPEAAVGDLAPLLSAGHGSAIAPLAPLLLAPLRQTVLTQPEFAFPLTGQRDVTLTVPAVQVRLVASTAATVYAGMQGRALRLGPSTVTIAKAQVVTPPAALGLGDERRLRLTLSFPAAQTNGTLDSVDVVVDGVSRSVSRDDPRVDLPLARGQQTMRVTLENPVVAVRGPWTIHLTPR